MHNSIDIFKIFSLPLYPAGGLVGHRETDARGLCAQRPRRQGAPATGLADQALAASKRRATSSQLTTL